MNIIDRIVSLEKKVKCLSCNVSNINSETVESFTGSTSTTITLSRAYIPGTVVVYKNGAATSSFTESGSTTITLTGSRSTGDTILIDYKY